VLKLLSESPERMPMRSLAVRVRAATFFAEVPTPRERRADIDLVQ
jgi:hypothetical protein